MMQTLYTALLDLAANENEELLSVFEQYAVGNHQATTNPKGHFLQSGSLSRMITYEPVKSEDEAKDRLHKVLEGLRNSNRDMGYGLTEISKVLSKEGIDKLLQVLVAQLNDKAVVDQFIDPLEQFQSLFCGYPLFDIVIEDICANEENGSINIKNANCTGGRYNIYLENHTSKTRTLIDFETKEAKVLYLWFALQAGKSYKKTSLVWKGKSFQELFLQCFHIFFTNTIEEKLRHPEVVKNNRAGFDRFWINSMSAAKRAVIKALKGMDTEEWYIVNYVNENYYLGIPREFIKLPLSLKEYDVIK